ncbi:6376_t:CDS:10 [Ambispora gerdemannii]|uniref:6376_t:CDS:1 n=1 Tax=Ambispora gerdemannii TaxID=144530 RepID=A0A9N8V4U1_9GLOM|nr:6376_t:CDS:10 [Ambispora gerdemannii]
MSMAPQNQGKMDYSSPTETQISPLQAHYLKKELISRQIQKELEILSEQQQTETIATTITDNTDNPNLEITRSTQTPFLQFIFSEFILTFPFLTNTEKDFWVKCLEFIKEFQKKNISGSSTRNEATKRRHLVNKIVMNLTLLLNAACKTTAGKDEVITVDSFEGEEEKMKPKMEINGNRQQQNGIGHTENNQLRSYLVNGWEFNIVAVKSVKFKRHFRDHYHLEYVILTKRPKSNATVVARRHKQFRALYSKLKVEFPDIEIPLVPTKIKEPNLAKSCENNRLNLRAYLRSLLSIRVLAKSKTLRVFLTSNPIKLTDEELKDMEERRKLDDKREEQQRIFNLEAGKRAKELDQQVENFKKGLLEQGGLSNLAIIIKETSLITDLPQSYQKLFEFGEINFASTLYYLFIGSDGSSENLAQLKRVHSLMPYKALRGILKISNPLLLMKAMLNLFMAQPFGSRSLLQRMISMNLSEEIKEIEKDINSLQEKHNVPEICQKIQNYVYASPSIQSAIREEADKENKDTISFIRTILASRSLEPQVKTERIDEFSKVHEKTGHSKKNILKKLMLLYIRKRDKEMMIDLLFQGVTGNLLRDLISIFYEPLARVYKTANIGESLPDLSDFVDDLIKVVEQAENKAIIQTDSTQSIVQVFVSLAHRHMQPFYAYVHSVYAVDSTNLFTSLLNWMQGIIDFLRTGFKEPLDLDLIINTHLNNEEQAQLFIDLENLMEWHTLRKRRHLENLKSVISGDGENYIGGMNNELKNIVGVHEDDLEEIEFLEESDGDGSSSNSIDDGSSPLDHGYGRYQLPPMPELKVLPKLLDPFVESIIKNIDVKTQNI